MSIVKYKLSNGKNAVYESTSYYDPDKKQERPKRRYLGIEDPDTGKFIPSPGKSERRRKNNASTPQAEVPPIVDSRVFEEFKKLWQEVSRLSNENRVLRRQNEELRKELSQYSRTVSSAISVLSPLVR